ncbi:Multicopper oxidase [Paramyrothecium foliicola]|nr:Multicopper oxidase [Paramyrothecium foliicola]
MEHRAKTKCKTHKSDVKPTWHRLWLACSVSSLLLISFWAADKHHIPLKSWLRDATQSERLTRRYELQTGVKWMNQDGGRWRVMFVCNGQSPCPTLYAEEGDLFELTVKSDLYAQSSIHWSGIGHKGTGSWNDGTAGISQYPILPRGNYTNFIDTTGSWGLNWYAEHTTAASADGLYGMVYVAPSSSRPRPYQLITSEPNELRRIMEAEINIKHIAIKNHQHRDTGWKMLRMRAEGSEFYCYDSLLVNGKGRVHCRQPGFEVLNGQATDETGCIQPPGLPEESCTPSQADYEIIETEGKAYIMMNLINIGFEHSVMVSIDSHKMVVVANNGGFTVPSETDVVYIPSAGRVTVLIKLDAEPGDYAMRIASTSQLQNLQGHAIIKYPTNKHPVYGEPMKLPQPVSPEKVCVLPDSSVKNDCRVTEGQYLSPYPSSPPPHFSRSVKDSPRHHIFNLEAGSQPSLTEPHITEYFLNEQPWQLYRSALTPLLFQTPNDTSSSDPLGKPVIEGIPLGSVVDLIIQNTLNDTIPLYKHGEAAWLLGTRAFSKFPYKNVEEAVANGGETAASLNLESPGLVTVHDLPPLGWSVLRFTVSAKAVTMIHAVKLRYFALGMSAPIVEGILPNDPVHIPASAINRPHVKFEPKNNGVFGKI